MRNASLDPAARLGALRLTSRLVAVEAALVAGLVSELRPCLLEPLLRAALPYEAAPCGLKARIT